MLSVLLYAFVILLIPVALSTLLILVVIAYEVWHMFLGAAICECGHVKRFHEYEHCLSGKRDEKGKLEQCRCREFKKKVKAHV